MQKSDTVKNNILDEAKELVHGKRGQDYGPPSQDHARTGRMWGAILGIPDVPAWKVALCMAALKISRECHRHKRDNLVDGAGYLENCQMCREEQHK